MGMEVARLLQTFDFFCNLLCVVFAAMDHTQPFLEESLALPVCYLRHIHYFLSLLSLFANSIKSNEKRPL